jgi:uncharacterized membrane protein
MTLSTDTDHAPRSVQPPRYRSLAFSDLADCLRAGLEDFAAKPAYGLFFGSVYAAAGIALMLLAVVAGQYVLILPLIMGFVLIGPFVALGLYEVSRRREAGLPLSFPIVLGVIKSHSSRQIVMLGFMLMVLLLFWVRVALLIYALSFGLAPVNYLTLAVDSLAGPTGFAFLLTGTIVGACFAFVAFSISVLSFPHLLAHEQDFISAIILSVKGVLANLVVMLAWGAFVAATVTLAMAPLFLGLIVVLPVLGHATWHLYRRTVLQSAGASAIP